MQLLVGRSGRERGQADAAPAAGLRPAAEAMALDRHPSSSPA